MGEKSIERFYDEVLCKDIRVLIDMLASLSNSYRLLAGAAEEFNCISLVHRREAEDAINRANQLGDVIDDLDKELKRLMKLYLRELACKVEIQQLYNNKLAFLNSSDKLSKELREELEQD